MNMNKSATNLRAKKGDELKSLSELIVQLKAQETKYFKPPPIWLCHKRYRGMDRKARRDLMDREEAEREALRAERFRDRDMARSSESELVRQRTRRESQSQEYLGLGVQICLLHIIYMLQ